MRSPESFGGSVDSSANATENLENNEALRAVNRERGEEVNEAYIDDRRKALLNERDRLIANVESQGIKVDRATGRPILPNSAGESLDSSETTPAELAKNARKNLKFKKVIAETVLGLIAVVTVGGVVVKNIKADSQPANPQATEMEAPAMTTVNIPESVTTVTFEDSAEKERQYEDGYDKDGMWLSDSKPNTVAFSDFEKVVAISSGDKREALIYNATNEVEAMSDYIAALPDAVYSSLSQNSALAQFKGLSESEVNKKLESKFATPEYADIGQEFNDLISRSEVKDTTLNGKHSNAYMAVKDSGNLYGSKATIEKGLPVNHDNMQLIQCTTTENNTKAYEYSWYNDGGQLLGSITVKASCGQAVEKEGSSKRFAGLPEAVESAIESGGSISIVTPGGGNKTPTSPGTKPGTTPEDPADPEPKDPTKPEPRPEDKIAPKDGDNLERIDDQINKDIADDIHTGIVNPGYNPGVSDGDQTEKPSEEAYEGTEPTIQPNQPSEGAETVQPTSPENNYSEDHGGANSGNSNENPVESNDQGQQEADRNEQTELPKDASESGDALADLGIE